jgi:hypothetical protein
MHTSIAGVSHTHTCTHLTRVEHPDDIRGRADLIELVQTRSHGGQGRTRGHIARHTFPNVKEAAALFQAVVKIRR